jgi:hypothetical protein
VVGESWVVPGANVCPTAVGIVVDTGFAVELPEFALEFAAPLPEVVSELSSDAPGIEADPSPFWVGVDPVPGGDADTGVDGEPT